MHVGLKNKCYPDLYVDNWELRKTDEIFINVEDLVDEESGSLSLMIETRRKVLVLR